MQMERRGLDPLVGEDAKVLILGTFPGEESLKCRQYYVASSNQFWDIMGDPRLVGITRDQEYAVRAAALTSYGIALWDVLESCTREGSSDSNIRPPYRPNDFGWFLSAHRLKAILLNGEKAHLYFVKFVAPNSAMSIHVEVLPNTSGANTHYTKNQKTEAWLELKRFL